MTDTNPLPECLSHLAQRDPKPAPSYQRRVHDWMIHCFDHHVAADKIERNHRFLEEALELVQASGGSSDDAHKLVDYVFSRPIGNPSQEVGGVMVTLAALCTAHMLNMTQSGESELARNWTKSDAIRARWMKKPIRSGPLL